MTKKKQLSLKELEKTQHKVRKIRDKYFDKIASINLERDKKIQEIFDAHNLNKVRK